MLIGAETDHIVEDASADDTYPEIIEEDADSEADADIEAEAEAEAGENTRLPFTTKFAIAKKKSNFLKRQLKVQSVAVVE